MSKFKYVVLGVVLLLLAFTGIVLAWDKGSNATCQDVYVKIKNDNHYRYNGSAEGYEGRIYKKTGSSWVEADYDEGDVPNNSWAVVDWTPPANFVGWVKGYVQINNPSETGYLDKAELGETYLNCLPAPTSTPTPTLTPTPTQTPEPEYHSVCREYACVQVEGEGESECKVDSDCGEEITPTPTPEPTPTEEPKGRIELTPAGAPTCDGVPFVKLPANALVKRHGDSATVQWQPTQGEKANIYYREVQIPTNAHSVIETQNDGIEVISFLGNQDWEFGVQQLDGCASSGVVWVIDGAEYKLFSLPAYDIITGEFLK